MSDKQLTAADVDNLSDEDFMKLSDTDLMNVQPEPEVEEIKDEVEDVQPEGTVEPNTDPEDNVDPEDNGEVTPVEPEGDPEDQPEVTPEGGTPEQKLDGGQEVKDPEQPEDKTKETPATPEEKKDPEPKDDKKQPAASGEFKLPEGVTAEKVTAALGYYDLITAPFKADGKDISVRSPEDAVRLMQQGVNYSRRMQELKPMKNMVRMLADHGLNDISKLNHLIDISKGDKTAIAQLLKDKGVDPMDLDTTGEIGYQGNNYAGNAKDNAFRDALDNVMATPEGPALVNTIKTWDAQSKQRIVDDPSIIGNLQELQSQGHYQKIVDELEYQRSIGYLTDVPFLQAFDRVGEAMKSAGVFDTPKKADEVAPLASAQPAPLTSGTRKAQEPKNPEPNPHLSSTPVSTPQNQQPVKQETNYAELSDEDFMKLAPPV